MKGYYGLYFHRRYSIFAFMAENGDYSPYVTVENDRDRLRSFLRRLPRRSPIAMESIDRWYWIVDELENAGYMPLLVHAGKAKMMSAGMQQLSLIGIEKLPPRMLENS